MRHWSAKSDRRPNQVYQPVRESMIGRIPVWGAERLDEKPESEDAKGRPLHTESHCYSLSLFLACKSNDPPLAVYDTQRKSQNPAERKRVPLSPKDFDTFQATVLELYEFRTRWPWERQMLKLR
jgi:hypothetical protein